MNIEEQIKDLIEYKRLVIKLEDELNKKSSEINILLKHNSELKSLSQVLQNECDELNNKLISKNSEIKKVEKKYKEELDNITHNFDKQKEIYENKLLKLSSINPMNKEISIKREVEIVYEEKLKEKNTEIDLLNKKIKNLTDENLELRFEINNIKKTQDQLNNVKQEKDLFEELVNQEDDKKVEFGISNNQEKIKQLQMVIKEKEENIEKLYQEINKLKNEKNSYELNVSKKYFLDLRQLKELENQNNLLKREITISENNKKDIENRLIKLQESVEKMNREKEEIIKENNGLLLKINDLEKEFINNEEIQNDLDNLKELFQKYETEQYNNNLINEKIKKQKEEKSKKQIIELQKQLDESKEKQGIFIESNNLKSDNNFIDKIEPDNNIFKREYEKIYQKYNLLLVEEKRRLNDIKQIEEENENLNKYLKEAIKKGKIRKEKYSQLKEKYKELLHKKEHYKEICKIIMQNMEKILNILTPEQKNNIENFGNDYLIDLNSFSFTEII